MRSYFRLVSRSIVISNETNFELANYVHFSTGGKLESIKVGCNGNGFFIIALKFDDVWKFGNCFNVLSCNFIDIVEHFKFFYLWVDSLFDSLFTVHS